MNRQGQPDIIGSLDAVGNAKPLGYLPLATLETILMMDVSEVASSCERRGLRTKIFSAQECCVKSGALYAYDPAALHRVISENSEVLKRSEWPTDADAFVEHVAKNWVEQTDPVHAVIQRAFGGC